MKGNALIYSPLVKTAMSICFSAHAGQTDKSGHPYAHHPMHLAEQMDDELSACAALLHDVMEDTDVSAGQLRRAGMPDAVMDALALLTHQPGVPYMDYVESIATNPIARKVKLADLRHNSDLTRLDKVTDVDLQRVQKYAQAIQLLEQSCS